jgi:parallel beta-helix repeat protein
MHGTAWLIAMALVGGVAPLVAGEYYVAAGGSGAPGTSWATAFTNVQDALNAAVGGNDLIYVKGDTFTLPAALTWSASASGVTLRGGYEGAGTPGNHDAAQWPTVIRRDPAALNFRLIDMSGATGANIEDVTLANGKGVENINTEPGGGIRAVNSTLTLSGCTLTNNVAKENKGGGLYLENCTALVTNCLLSGNASETSWGGAGGGMYIASGTVEVWDCVLRGNGSTRNNGGGETYGGGIYVNAGDATIRNCLVVNNWCNGPSDTAKRGSGVFLNGGSALLANCTIVTNTAYVGTTATAAEGIRYAGGTVTLRDSIVWDHADDLANFPTNVAGVLTNVWHCDIGNGDNDGENGCVSVEPLFADSFYYHLRSMGGRYGGGYFGNGYWVVDLESSPLIDAGSTNDYSRETAPNGGRVNMGAYGNSPTASRSGASGVAETNDIWYVTSVGAGTPGTSWAGAFTNIQDALDAAAGGDLVCLAGDTFTLSNTLHVTQGGVTLRGGYQGTGTPGNHDPETWPTVIRRLSTDPDFRLLRLSGVLDVWLEYLVLTGGKSSAADQSGGAIRSLNSGLTVVQCTVTNNSTSEGVGGGICIQGGSVWIADTLLANNVNWTSWGAEGGGLYTEGADVHVVESIIRDNSAEGMNNGSSGKGGGAYVASGDVVFRNCLVYDNRCWTYLSQTNWFGAGLYLAGGNTLIQNCTVATNVGAAWVAGDRVHEGIRYAGGTVTLKDSIVAGHMDDLVGFPTNALGVLTGVSYCDIGNGDNDGVNGCIASDPLFADLPGRDLHLKARGSRWTPSGRVRDPVGSPCIDAGDPGSDYALEPEWNGGRVNLGAYGNTEEASTGLPLGTVITIR